MEAQLQIRQNAQEVQDYMRDLFAWEKSVKPKPSKPAAAGKPIPGAADKSAAAAAERPPADQPGGAAGHTFKHYDRWERFDAEAALRDASEDEEGPQSSGSGGASKAQRKAAAAAPQPPRALPSVPGMPPIRGSQQQRTPGASGSGGGGGGGGGGGSSGGAAGGSGTAGKPRAPSPEPSTAEGWKDRGNKLLQAGHAAEALACYDRSLAVAPTCLGHANRALALMRLRRHGDAEAAAGAALSIDPTYAKAWQRRGAARKELGRWLDAAEDWEGAVRLEPGNKAARAERDACVAEALKQAGAAGAAPPRQAVPVTVLPEAPAVRGAKPLGADELLRPRPAQPVAAAAAVAPAANPGAPPTVTKASSSSKAEAVGAAVPAAVENPTAIAAAAATAPGPRTPSPIAATAEALAPRGSPAGAPAPEASLPLTKPPAAPAPAAAAAAATAAAAVPPKDRQAAAVAAAAEAAAAALAAKAAERLRAPRSSVEFEAAWRSLRSDPALQSRYLALLDGPGLPALFKDSLTPPVLISVTRACLSAVAAAAGRPDGAAAALAPGAAVGLLQGLAKASRFGTMVMCLGRQDRAELGGLWDAAAAAAAPGLAAQLQPLRASYRV